ncbi:TonB family protein [Parashewanella spongiae]|nr:energy transducer TonB [Parashewanella spongiae]MCL1080125.1 TonB family protein [Parashewanella spongiae]
MEKSTVFGKTTVIVSAVVITLALFYFMTLLIDKQPVTDPSSSTPTIGAAPSEKEPKAKDKIRQIEKKPKPETPTKAKFVREGTEPVVKLPEAPTNPTMPILTHTSSKVTEFVPMKTTDGAATALVKIAPLYPADAARDGKEGWVVLGFDISTDGKVINAEVLDSDPKKIFDKAAKKALKNWRYQPKVEDGVAIVQENQRVQLDFELDK